jgi:CheY-like chemotaxis protein
MPLPQRQHICIVDDDEQFRTLFRHILQQQGYAVLEAPDGQRALEIINASPSRLIVVLAQALSERDSLTVFSALLADGALAKYHAYLLLSVAPRLSPALESLVALLKVSVMSQPEDLHSVLKHISMLAHRLEIKRARDGLPALSH